MQRCPQGANCFVEKSREQARASDLIVTNHALLAIDAMHGGTALPEHDAVIIDEAHELVARVTGAASAELSPQAIERVARRVLSYLEDELALEFLESADVLRTALDETALERVEDPDSRVHRRLPPDRRRHPPGGLASCPARRRRPIRNAVRRLPRSRRCSTSPNAWWRCRRTTWSGWPTATGSGARRGWRRCRSPACCASGSSPSGRSCSTSATLKLGGDFDGVAASLGLRADERVRGQ